MRPDANLDSGGEVAEVRLRVYGSVQKRKTPENLSSAAAELIEDVLGPRKPEAVASEATMVQFLLGTLDPIAEADLIALLVQDSDRRLRLLEIDAEIEQLREMPVAEAAASPFWQELAAALRESMGAFRASLAAASRAISMAQSIPQFATARGGTVDAEIDERGTLRAQLPDSTELRLADPGGEGLPLGTGKNGVVEVSDFTDLTGMPSGPISSGLFLLDDSAAARYLFVEDGDHVLAVELLEAPTLKNETLRFVLGPLPVPALNDGTVVISLPAGNDEQTLVREPLAPWPPEGRTFMIRLPGFEDATLSTASLLRLRVVRNLS